MALSLIQLRFKYDRNATLFQQAQADYAVVMTGKPFLRLLEKITHFIPENT